MNKLLLTASALVLVASVSSVQAEEWPRWYVGLSGGMSFLNDSDVGGASTGNVDFDNGGFANVSLGYLPPIRGFGNFRVEAELGYHYNSIDTVQLGATTGTSRGNVQMYSYMANLYYDFRGSTRWAPYVGAGAGGASVNIDRSSSLALTGDSDHVLAYQLMAGVSYRPATLPNTEWYAGYRYFTAQDPEFTNASGRLELDDLISHNAEVGARFRF